MVTCNKTRGYHSYKKMRVISKVSITGITLFFVKITNIKATSKLAILFLLYKVMELHMICKRHEIKTGGQLSYQEMRVISKVSTTCRTQFICQDPYH